MEDRPPITADLGIHREGGYGERISVTAEISAGRLRVTGSRGQNTESVTATTVRADDTRGPEELREIRAIWERWHMNDMRAGCAHQERGARLFGDYPYRPGVRLDTIGRPCAICGYRYGTAWNREEVPAEVIARLWHLLDDDAWISAEPVDDDDQEEPEEFPHARRIDSRELIGRTFGPEVDAELEDAAGYSPDWNYGAQLVAVEDFEQYAREFADSIGAVDASAGWPTNHVDWSAAAQELQQDWTSVTIDGSGYFIR